MFLSYSGTNGFTVVFPAGLTAMGMVMNPLFIAERGDRIKRFQDLPEGIPFDPLNLEKLFKGESI
jgi:hypothetical protein